MPSVRISTLESLPVEKTGCLRVEISDESTTNTESFLLSESALESESEAIRLSAVTMVSRRKERAFLLA